MELDTTEIEAVLNNFGSKLIQNARRRLTLKKKRARGVLFNQMSYDVEKTVTGVDFKVDFGLATHYWRFVDEGVQGAGGFKGSGRARGYGSPFRFGTNTGPRGGLRKAIRRWINTKGIKGRIQKDWKNSRGAGRFITNDSLVFLISRSIYQRGLERTRFISQPFSEMYPELIYNMELASVKDVETTEDKELKTQHLKIKINTI